MSTVEAKLNFPTQKDSFPLLESVKYGGFSKDGRIVWSLDESKGLLSFSRLPPFEKGLNKFSQFSTGGLQLETHCRIEYETKEYIVLVFAESASQSLILVFSLMSALLVRVLRLPFLISAIAGVSHMSLSIGLFMSPPLQSFSGVIACGCGQTGRVILIDLVLAHSHQWPRPILQYPRDVKVLSYNVDDLPIHSTNSIRDGVHLALDINGRYVKRNGSLFQYPDPTTNKLIGSFEGVSVTAIHHFPLAAGLLVGYSFGGFQLYSLLDSTLLYSLPLILRRLPTPVTHFAVQEPENDPKNFLYVWVSRNGPKAQHVFGSSPSVTMYQMAFKKKIDHSNTVLYQVVEGCNRRFEHTMWPWHNTSAVMINSSTIIRPLPLVKGTSHTSTPPTDSTLVMFMCRGVEEEGRGMVTVFDLNGWYNSQVPLHPGWSDINKLGRKTCPYLIQFEVSSDHGCILNGSTSLVSVDKSVSFQIESHSFLESLSMSFNIVSNEDVSIFQLEGLRSQVITELLTHGSTVMSNPHHYVSQLQCVGLVPILGGSSEPGSSLVGRVIEGMTEMQYFILSVCLQHGFQSVLMSVVGSCVVAGYQLSLGNMIEWIKKTLEELVTEKNNMIDRLVFADELHPAVISHANLLRKYFSVLVKAIETLSTLSDGINDDITLLYCTANIHHEIMETTHWCMETGLLPHLTDAVVDPDALDKDCFVFPSNELARRYEDISDKRENSGLALDHLIRDLEFVDKVPFQYPTADISCILKVKAYPDSISQQLIILYILLDVATPPGDPTLAQQYCDRFHIDCIELAVAVWNIDHGNVPPTISDNRLIEFNSIFELAVLRLLSEGMISEAIGYLLECDDGTYHHLRIRAFTAAGHVTRASRILEESVDTDDYGMLLECFINSCLSLSSEHGLKLVRMQLSDRLLDDVCGALCDVGSGPAVHLALCLLLNHRRHVEAISLAKEGEETCQLASSLANSNLLLPSLATMCSEELIKNTREEQTGAFNGGSEPFSSVLVKSAQYSYTSQADMLLALTEKRNDDDDTQDEVVMSGPAFTPFKKTLSSSSHSQSSIPKRLLTSVPFVSSPRHSSRPQRIKSLHEEDSLATPPESPQLVSSVYRSGKKEGRTEMNVFMEQMEGFKARMAILNAMNRNDDKDHFIIKTPLPNPSIPATPTSILKAKQKMPQTSSPPIFTETTTRRIRFALEDSGEKLSSSAVAIETPLPPSDDDSDSFYSLDGSTDGVDGVDGGVAQTSVTSPPSFSSEVILSDTGHTNGRSNGEGEELSFVAAEEDEKEQEQSVSTSQLKSALKLSHLTRGSLHSSYISPAPVSRDPSLTTSIITDTISLSPVIKLPKRRLPTSKQTPKLLASKQRSTPVHSSVMVATQEYTFSPPSTVAPPPPPTSTATPMAVDDEASTPPAQDKAEYVFSPPLLRSASRERKAKELSQFGTGLVADTPNTRRTSSAFGQKSKEKPLKSVKGVSRRRK